jgi:23S rRNA (guanosine2251-2'-O)-methyltransferase
VARHGRGNDARGWSPRLDHPFPRRRRHASQAAAGEWIWGWRPVLAALANPARAAPRRLVATPERSRQLQQEAPGAPAPETADAAAIVRLLPAGAAHQGVALLPGALEPQALDAVASPADGVLVMLDQVTDPQNVGAVIRSAAAFGARGLIVQDRHCPPFAGAVAKAAAGAIDAIPLVREVNLARALDRLGDLGWRTVGLAEAAATPLADAIDARPTVLVMGSEGAGLRRLVGEHCDALARIPTGASFASLNVAAAAAVALYEASRVQALRAGHA